MQKSKLLVVGVALILVAILYHLPKVVIDAEHEDLENVNEGNSGIMEQKFHDAQLREEESKEIDSLLVLSKSNTANKEGYYRNIAVLWESKQNYESAALFYKKIAEMQPSYSNWLKAADIYFNAFGFALDREKAAQLGEEARLCYDKVINGEWDQPIERSTNDLKSNIAVTYLATPQPMKGISILREVIDNEPDNQTALYHLGVLSIQSRQYDKAVGRFKKLISLDSGNVEVAYYLAVSYFETGQRAEAKEIFERIKLSDKNTLYPSVEEYLKKLN